MKMNLQQLDWEGVHDEINNTHVMSVEYALIAVMNMIDINGIEFVTDNLSEGAKLQMMAEVANYAAKTLDYSFYYYKGDVVTAAALAGCEHGWGDDNAFYLESEIGQSAFHDPMGEIKISQNVSYKKEWSGILRQQYAFHIASNLDVRRVFSEATTEGGALCGISNSAVERAVSRLLNY